MKILALDSTATTATAALCADEALIGLYTLNSGNTQSETLLPMIESLLRVSGWQVSDIDMFACAQGPGSFTGVRIGAATIKGLAFDSGKPCIGVSTLEALAYNLSDRRGLVCPVMNARRGQVYNALFSSDGTTLRRICPDRAISLDELAVELATAHEPIFLTGDGYDIAKKAPENNEKLQATPVLLQNQNAYSVAQLALQEFRAGKHTTDFELTPSYLRLPQAERERNERLARQQKEQASQ